MPAILSRLNHRSQGARQRGLSSLAACAILAGVVILCLAMLPGSLRAQEPSGAQLAAAMENVLVDAIAQAEKSVVAVARVKRSETRQGGAEVIVDQFGNLRRTSSPPQPGDPDFVPNEYGTGIAIDKHGLVLTHYHVLAEDCDYFVTTSERKTYPARIKAADPRSDLAVLSIEAQDLSPIKLGDASALKKGQIVISLGNPYGIARDGQVSASWGIVSNLNRKAAVDPSFDATASPKTKLQHLGTLIQTDAKLNLGTSGGALLNLKGEMIGLTTSLATISGYDQSAGYAIPVDDTFRRAVDALKQGREVEYGFLGIQPNSFSGPEIRAGKHGTIVKAVVPGTPASRSGLELDDVITHVNGEPIHDADSLVLSVGKLPVETVVRLTVERRGQIRQISAELAKYNVPGVKIATVQSPSWRGLRVDHSTAIKEFNERVNQGDIDLNGCVVITEVEQDSPAWKEGLRPHRFLSYVGSTRVSTPKEFQAAVAGKAGPVQVKLYVPSPGSRYETHSIPANSP